DASAWTLDAARGEARKLRVEFLDKQKDPAAAKAKRMSDARNVVLFGVVKRDYLQARRADLRPRSLEGAVHNLENLWRPFDAPACADITPAAIAAQLRVIAQKRGMITANRARSTLSAMFAWAIGEGLCDANPVIGTNKPQKVEKPRERVLTDAELAAIWKAC